MANILKIVFLGIIGFAGLVYLTAPENKINNENKVSVEDLNISLLPEYYELVGNNGMHFSSRHYDLKGIASNSEAKIIYDGGITKNRK